ncbi:nuclear speckle splicing regulatory protein 1 [Rhinolophus ferrumequinum]|uniref:Nuclear speckle splicing regulatory protein 1 n=2 Tax=Rhinolophus ferrumequinum TaxID=59479 RepID=A0A671F123_RHIFE|nr:nuclear speckle splicing regulatory protein 1 isoform X1 [Rhinolophus ferrumequinum]KAF6299273.1 nuclear speckle splicing regulatory protein 1 [Rhinolophus ferrumequinum]
MAIPGRQYGLVLPKKAQQLLPVLQKPSVFGNDSDDDDETSVSESLQREAAKKQAMKQTKLEIQKALAEDSTVYEYDSIYDEMQKKKEENNPKLLLGKDRKPKYIHNLLKAVEIRKKEQEKRMEKKIQREREMEKGEFDDKEAFVTSAYKKKLQERAEEEEREKRAAALEARLDVTKQKDLSGFYRHLLNQAVGEEEVPTCSFREARSGIKEEKPRGYSDEVSSENRTHEKSILQTVVKVEENLDADSDLNASSSEDDKMEERGNCRREKSIETSMNDSKLHRNQTHSRSSSEEREHGTKHHTKSSKSRGHEKREDQHQERQSRDQNYYTDRDYRKEKKDSHRHREASQRDSHWKRHEQEDKLRSRDQRERNDREWKREKYPRREQERERQRNDHDQHSEKGEEKEEKSKEKEEQMKARKERHEDSDKYRDREKRETSGQSSERKRDRKESSPNSRATDRFLDQERSHKMRNMEKDKERNPEKPSSSETSLGTKHSITEECQETGKEQERLDEAVNKFAKRNNEETVMSARDRYLARQMARGNAKTYIEKEDD